MMNQIAKNAARLAPRAMSGDPTAISLLAVLGLCAAGAYVVQTIKGKS